MTSYLTPQHGGSVHAFDMVGRPPPVEPDFFFFNDTPPPEISPLPLRDVFPISGVGDRGRREPDDLGETRGDPRPDPGRAQRPVSLAGTDVGAHHSDERATEPEHQRERV